ncbi:hypothetical protein, partial [Mesorhizobium sp. M2A.F.Ca.ET.039.01.1.1]|uniref:hypothetical protein n=1 Tax=Mesorhizobium sp. M2A.F.Ca.ET.039.01.1.1 TaxID=2496746 RepID=UPI001AEC8FEE
PSASREHPYGTGQVYWRRSFLYQFDKEDCEAADDRQIRFNAFDMNCVGHQSPGPFKPCERRLEAPPGIEKSVQEDDGRS